MDCADSDGRKKLESSLWDRRCGASETGRAPGTEGKDLYADMGRSCKRCIIVASSA